MQNQAVYNNQGGYAPPPNQYGQNQPLHNPNQPQYNQPYNQQPQYQPQQQQQQSYGQQPQNAQTYQNQNQQQSQHTNSNPYQPPPQGEWHKPKDQDYNREGYTGKWKIDMLTAPCKEPLYFCLGCFCACCFVYKQREEILEITGEPYRCFGGHCCVPCPEMPKVPCLCLESCCCTGNAIMANRYMIRDMYVLELDPCDECLICVAVALSWIVCILQVLGVIPDDSPLEQLADCFITMVLGCSLAQNQSELNYHQGK